MSLTSRAHRLVLYNHHHLSKTLTQTTTHSHQSKHQYISHKTQNSTQ